jgi:hypothetical protein
MRIFEIASAEDQIALWQLVSTSVWQSLEQQLELDKKKAQADAKKQTASKRLGRAAKVPAQPRFTPVPVATAVQQRPAVAPTQSASQLAAAAASNPTNPAKIKQSEPVNAKKKSDDDLDDRHSENTRPLTASRSPLRR